MAAVLSSPLLFFIFLGLIVSFEQQLKFGNHVNPSRIGFDLNLSQFLQLNRKCRSLKSTGAPTRPVGVWLKRGHNCIYLPNSRDITICMDVECNPGPVDLNNHHQTQLRHSSDTAQKEI